jgi:hypothetical protein
LCFSAQNTTLFISYADVDSTNFQVAMLVLETIMDQSECADLPASNAITFTGSCFFASLFLVVMLLMCVLVVCSNAGVSVNGRAIKWTDRVQSTQCAEKITDQSSTVTFRWNAQQQQE